MSEDQATPAQFITKTLMVEAMYTTVPTSLVHAFGYHAAVYLQEIYFLCRKPSYEDGYTFITEDQIKDNASPTLDRVGQGGLRAKLRKLGVLETKLIKVNGKPRLHYRVNVDTVHRAIEPLAGE